MRHRSTTIAIALIAGLTITGCGRMNPLNLFGGSEEIAVTSTVVDGAEITDGRGLIDQILSLDVAPVQGGIIVRATGVADRQGDWDAELIVVPAETQERLNLAFVARDAPGGTRVSTQRSREITVARRFTEPELSGIREISVTGARNARAVRR